MLQYCSTFDGIFWVKKLKTTIKKKKAGIFFYFEKFNQNVEGDSVFQAPESNELIRGFVPCWKGEGKCICKTNLSCKDKLD